MILTFITKIVAPLRMAATAARARRPATQEWLRQHLPKAGRGIRRGAGYGIGIVRRIGRWTGQGISRGIQVGHRTGRGVRRGVRRGIVPGVRPGRRSVTPQRLGIAAGALVLTVAVVVTGALLRPSSDPLVPDGGDPSACVSDAYPVAEIPIATKNGAPVGTLQLQHSARCRTSWGRLAYTSRQPPQGWDVLLTVTRPSDGRHEEQAAHLLAHAVFTGTVHPGQSCLVVSAEVKNSPGGAVKTASPCVKP